MERPLIIITFQGVLGDFFKDGGVSAKQDCIMSNLYLKRDAPNTTLQSDAPPNYHMWARIGVVDGLKYLSKHFYIVVVNKDTNIEDIAKDFS